jgi:FkbM family methyltransferase
MMRKKQMTFTSYAQNFEDIMLWRALRNVENGFYIDVGAYLPSEDSVTRAFYDRGWHGINVEPNPVCLSELLRDRPRDINLGVAIVEQEGPVDLFIIADTGLTTVNSDIANLYLANGFTQMPLEVLGLKMSSLWTKYVSDTQDVHFLKIDIEGHEEQALRGMDWAKNRPWIVVIESTFPSSQTETHANWEHLLLNANYIMAYWDGLNRFYVAQEHSALLAAFSSPPNVFDEFQLARFSDLAEKNQSEIAHLTQKLQTMRGTIARDTAQTSHVAREIKDGQETIARDLTQLLHLTKDLHAAQEKQACETEMRLEAERMAAARKPRSPLSRLFFRSSGRPRHLVWRFFFHKSGRPRGIFKHFVFHDDGRPHGEFRQWVESDEYLAMAGAVRQQAREVVDESNLTNRGKYFLTRLKSNQSKDESK